MMIIHKVIKYLRGGTSSKTDIFSCQKEAIIKAELIIRLYYLILLYFMAISIKLWQKWLALDVDALSLLWPVLWMQSFDITISLNVIMLSAFAATLLCIIYPHILLFRVLSFLFFFQFVAFNYSFGKIGHSYHGILAFGFVLLFLPNKKLDYLKTNIKHRHIYLSVFLAAQALVLLFYSLAGFWKIYHGVFQFLAGEIGSFSPSALAYQTAKSFLQKNSSTIFGHIVINNPTLGWPLYLSTLYLEFCSFVVAFRPSLHRFWGLCLILFHIGSGLITGPMFGNNILLLSILFVCSPFSRNETKAKDILVQLPIFGSFNNIFWRIKRNLLSMSRSNSL